MIYDNAGNRLYEPIITSNELEIRKFKTGADRDLSDHKIDYEGFLSPLVIQEFGKYMHKHRIRKDGTLRDSSNWQLGIPQDEYLKSAFRHFIDIWLSHRGHKSEDRIASLCAMLFNIQGYLHEELCKQKHIV